LGGFAIPLANLVKALISAWSNGLDEDIKST